METKEVKDLLDQIAADFQEFKTAQDDKDVAKAAAIETAMDAARDEIKEIKTAMARTAVVEGVEEAKERAPYETAFEDYAIKGDEAGVREYKATTVHTGANAEGGFIVPPSLEQGVIELLRELTPARSYCNVVSLASATYNRNVQDVLGASGWVTETGSRSNTVTPEFDQFTITPYEMYANPQVTLAMLEDSQFNFEAWLSTEVSKSLATLENTAFTVGDGSGKPSGLDQFVGASAGPQSIKENVAAATGAITADEVIDLIYSIKPQYRRGASFVMNRLTLASMRKLKDSDGRYMFEPALQLDGSAIVGRILGFPVYENEDVADMAAGAVALYFGDFNRGYTIVDRATSMSTLRNPFVSPGKVEFYTRRRVGGGVEDANAIQCIKMAAS